MNIVQHLVATIGEVEVLNLNHRSLGLFRLFRERLWLVHYGW